MLHLRVVCSAADTDAVIARLRAAPGVAHLTLLRGVALVPEGDLV